ncbi:MAG: S8 family serine peptidase [Nanoarchaeota archaeon]
MNQKKLFLANKSNLVTIVSVVILLLLIAPNITAEEQQRMVKKTIMTPLGEMNTQDIIGDPTTCTFKDNWPVACAYEQIDVNGKPNVQTIIWGEFPGYLVKLKEAPLAQMYKGKTPSDLKAQADKISQEHQIFKQRATQIKGVTIKREFSKAFNGFSILADEEGLKNLQQDPAVEKVMINQPVHAILLDSTQEIQAAQSWQHVDSQNNSYRGKGVSIAIIDTGIDYTHRDFGSCQDIGMIGCRVAGGYDFINDDDDPMDDHGHGTHVASIAAGNGIVRGVAPGATLYAYKVLSSGGSGSWDQVIAGIERAMDPNNDNDFSDHLDVISMSLGGGGNPDDPVSTAVDNAVGVGVVSVIAAGNWGSSPESIASPGTARQAITVGASCMMDQIGQDNYCQSSIASFSSRGPVIWNGETIAKPEVVAPGVSICAAQWQDAWHDRECIDTEHTAISGTSMATPHVAGAVALLLQKNPSLTPAQVKQILMENAHSFSDAGVYDQGAGLIDVWNTLDINPLFHGQNSLTLSVNPVSSISTALTTLTLTPDNSPETVQVIPEFLQGITGLANPATVLLDTAKQVQVEYTIDNTIVPSGKTYQGDVLVQSNNYVVKIPTTFIINDRLTAEPSKIDFDIFPPMNAIYSSTKQVTLTNMLQDEPQEYDIHVECCSRYDNNGYLKFVQPNVLSLNVPSHVLLNPSEHKTIEVIAQGDNDNWLDLGIYRGKLVISSNLQELRIPFELVKYYRLDLGFDIEPVFIEVYQGQAFQYFVYPYSFFNNETLYLTGNGDTDISVLSFLPYEPYATIYSFKENIQLVDQAYAHVPNAEHAYDITFNFKDEQGNTLDSEWSLMSIMGNFNEYYWNGWATWWGSSPSSINIWTSQASQDFVFAWSYLDSSSQTKTYHISDFKRGFAGDFEATNTPGSLAATPVSFQEISNEQSVVWLGHYVTGIGEYSQKGLSSAQFPEQTLYQQAQSQGMRAGFQIWYTSASDPWEQILETMPLFNAQYRKIYGLRTWNGEPKKIIEIEGTKQVGMMPLFWFGDGYLFNNGDSVDMYLYNEGRQFYPFLTQSLDLYLPDPYTNPLDYKVYVNGNQIGSGSMYGGTFWSWYENYISINLGSGPGNYKFETSRDYTIQGNDYTGKVEITMPIAAGEYETKYFPHMISMMLFSDGAQTDTLDFYKHNRIKAMFDTTNTGALGAISVKVFDGLNWYAQPTNADLVQGIIDATLTIPLRPSNQARKIMIEATTVRGVKLAYTFEVPLTTQVPPSTPPSISNVRATEIMQRGANIRWQTDLPASSRVYYGLSSNWYGNVQEDARYIKDHTIQLTNLVPNTLYHYQVWSTNQIGSRNSNDFTFMTKAITGSKPRPTESGQAGQAWLSLEQTKKGINGIFIVAFFMAILVMTFRYYKKRRT